MRPFVQLTAKGKLQRLARLARLALRHYPIRVRELHLLSIQTNVLFRIDTEDGRRYVLRIGIQYHSTLEQTQVETEWLRALVREGEVQVVRPVARVDRALVTAVAGAPSEAEIPCVLFEWVPGQRLAEHLSLETYRELGRSMALLHRHAETFVPPASVRLRKWTGIGSDSEAPAVLRSRKHIPHLSGPERHVIRQALEKADEALGAMYQGDARPILLHGDLHMWNVHCEGGQLVVLDFDDLFLGHPAQDIAITLFYGHNRPDYEALCRAFRAGYEHVRPWPLATDEQLRTLLIARRLELMNYSIWALPDAGPYLRENVARLRQMLSASQAGRSTWRRRRPAARALHRWRPPRP
ncbi:phosphotransferase [Pyxidicoccus fallax]|uniref:Phosphotransferase n=1 Tax=Pyxidicoccus fallax TaxID=394095 RepID=A0A848LJ83_9BACT|nr:phosphotransferase [Pyxidicoccus fallax]NMO17807.1 phosphotransferase [Pyxidicoccus fallax]NPC79847.1 phosphotransferase [Pyxidicoccus fallax]